MEDEATAALAAAAAAVAAVAVEARLILNSLTIESENIHESFSSEGPTYTIWQQFGTNNSDASSESPNIRVPIFGIQPEFYLFRRWIYLLAQIEKWSIWMCVIGHGIGGKHIPIKKWRVSLKGQTLG